MADNLYGIVVEGEPGFTIGPFVGRAEAEAWWEHQVSFNKRLCKKKICIYFVPNVVLTNK